MLSLWLMHIYVSFFGRNDFALLLIPLIASLPVLVPKVAAISFYFLLDYNFELKVWY